MFAYELPDPSYLEPTSRSESPDEVYRKRKVAELRRERTLSMRKAQDERERAARARARRDERRRREEEEGGSRETSPGGGTQIVTSVSVCLRHDTKAVLDSLNNKDKNLSPQTYALGRRSYM